MIYNNFICLYNILDKLGFNIYISIKICCIMYKIINIVYSWYTYIWHNSDHIISCILYIYSFNHNSLLQNQNNSYQGMNLGSSWFQLLYYLYQYLNITKTKITKR